MNNSDFLWGLMGGSVLSGFIASFHCVGMCAPLSCALTKSEAGGSNRLNLIQYHLGRMISYGILGFLAGALGSIFFEGIPIQPFKIVGWFFLATYILFVWGFEMKLTPGTWGFQISRWTYPWIMKLKCRSGWGRGMSLCLGLMTPFLPCTPLYLSTSAAFLSAKGIWGMSIMIGFVLGTLPVYGSSQLFWFRMQSRWSPSRREMIRRGLAAMAVMIMGWRLYSGEFLNREKSCHSAGVPRLVSQKENIGIPQ